MIGNISLYCPVATNTAELGTRRSGIVAGSCVSNAVMIISINSLDSVNAVSSAGKSVLIYCVTIREDKSVFSS